MQTLVTCCRNAEGICAGVGWACGLRVGAQFICQSWLPASYQT